MSTFGFIILRCVRKPEHNKLFKECYNCIRKIYNELIIIIDDNSDKNILEEYNGMVNTKVVNSEFKAGCGELLPYYYFYKLKPFDKAILLQDSMFIQEKIDIDNIKDMKFLWHFTIHSADEIAAETDMLSKINKIDGLIEFYKQKNKWYGCFGVMSIVNYHVVKLFNDKYNLFALLQHVSTRKYRMGLERLIGMLAFFEGYVVLNNCSIIGDIIRLCPSFRNRYDTYIQKKVPQSKIIKVWCGR